MLISGWPLNIFDIDGMSFAYSLAWPSNSANKLSIMFGEVARPAGNLGRLTMDLGRDVKSAAARSAIFS